VIQEEPFQVLETIPVGLRPMDVTVDDETGRVYVANGEGDNIAVIDGEALRLVDTIPLAMQPRAALVHPSEEDVYVVNANTNSVYVIRGNEVVDEIPVGVYPVAAAFDLDGSRLFVANQVDGTMSVIDIETGAVVTTIAVGEQPQAVAVDPENGQIYVGSLVLDGETLEPVGEIVLNPSSLGYPIVPQQIRVDPQGNRLYVVAFNGIPGSNGADMIYVLDRASREPIQTEHRLSQPSVLDLVLDPVAQRLYSVAGRFGRNSVIVEALPQGQDLATLELWKYPRSVGYNPDTEHLFIGLNPGSRPDVDQRPEIRVLRQDLTKVNALPFPGRPGAMAVDTKAGRVYVCDQAGGQVIVIQDMRVE
jgi:YVTN family beta-propeller protein